MGAVLDNSNLNEAQGWAASAVARQRNYFESGATRSYAFRLRQLKKLKEAIAQYQGQIQDALHADIGRPPFEAYIEISTAIEDLKHLKNWMKHATRNTQHARAAVGAPFQGANRAQHGIDRRAIRHFSVRQVSENISHRKCFPRQGSGSRRERRSYASLVVFSQFATDLFQQFLLQILPGALHHGVEGGNHWRADQKRGEHAPHHRMPQ